MPHIRPSCAVMYYLRFFEAGFDPKTLFWEAKKGLAERSSGPVFIWLLYFIWDLAVNP